MSDTYKTQAEVDEAIRTAIPCYMNRCSGFHVERKGPYGSFFGCTKYPQCKAKTEYRLAQDLITSRVFGENPNEDDPIRWDE